MTKDERELLGDLRKTLSTSATVFPKAKEHELLALIDRLAAIEEAARLDLADSYPSRCAGCVGGNAPDDPPDCPGHETATVERLRAALAEKKEADRG